MKQEDKQLLLRDLCPRLPYGVMMKVSHLSHPIALDEFILFTIKTGKEEGTPYLRPMSSMTEEEEDEYDSMFSNARRIHCNCTYYDTVQEDDIPDFTDWLLEHHFDYRGLIPMGLALEAPKDMYTQK